MPSIAGQPRSYKAVYNASVRSKISLSAALAGLLESVREMT